MEVLFTFGTDKQFPYKNGYLTIQARNLREAIDEFRLRYPNPKNSTLVNCADYYYRPEDVERIKTNKNLGVGCHKNIDLIDTSTLYGLLYHMASDLDTSDKVYDSIVTAAYISPTDFIKHRFSDDSQYYRFCYYLYTHIKTVDYSWVAENYVCDYSGFIAENINVLRQYSNKNWVRNNYPDIDDFTSEWINEFHGFLAGNATDANYRELVDSLEAYEQERETQREEEKSKDNSSIVK